MLGTEGEPEGEIMGEGVIEGETEGEAAGEAEGRGEREVGVRSDSEESCLGMAICTDLVLGSFTKI